MSARVHWCLCPCCRVFIDQVKPDAILALGAAEVRCPWCARSTTLPAWLEAGKRDLCECGCPRAAHTGYVTTDGEPPRGDMTQGTVIVSAPCVGCGCTRISGAREVRLS